MAKTKTHNRRRQTTRRRVRSRKAARVRAGARRKAARATRKARRPAARRPKILRRRASRRSPRRAIARSPSKSRKPAGAPIRLERDRRRLPDVERLEPVKGMTDARMISAARAGHDELKAELQRHTETSPTLTAGDIDAKWQDAYAIGDEAPGGDNPTPDQDHVDDIGKALGVQYQDNEELMGGEEIGKRDQHRWELDPASSDDWPHKDVD